MQHLVLTAALIIGALGTPEAQEAVHLSSVARGTLARATLIDSSGREVGQARLRQTAHGALLRLD